MSHRTFRDAVAQHFRAHAGEWVHYGQLMAIGGQLAWRTRVSECRRDYGMRIENRLERAEDGLATSYYRYVPAEMPEQASFL